MNKKSALSVLFILTIFAGAIFINFTSAEMAVNNASPDASTTLVISQVYGGGGSTSGTPTYTKDYVELKNISGSPQSLNGLSLQYGSATGQFGSSATNVFALPNTTLQPGQFYLVELGPVGTVGGALPVPADVSTTNLTVSATAGKIALTNGLAPNTCGATATPCTLPNAQIIDLVAYGTANNAEGNAPVAALTNTSGAVRNGNGCQDTDNNAADFTIVTPPVPRNSTTIAPCSGGTPTPTGTPTATPTTTPTGTPTATPTATPTPGPAVPGIKINEIYGGGGNAGALYNQDFIELYNSGSTSVDISGYSVQYAAATNQTATGYAVCAITGSDTVIEPGTYFLISTGPISSTVGTGLPAVNLVCQAGLNLSGTAGKVALVNGTTGLNGTTCPPTGATIVDFVGYGTTANCSETAPAPPPANSQSSIQRTPIGTDTNNNAADFTSGTPSPTAGNGTISRDANVDFDGDGKSDYVVTRAASGVKNWYISANGTGAFSGYQFGAAGDIEVPEDYDGDGKDDIAVYRPGAPSAFYILQSNGSVFTSAAFGQTGDDPKVVADYDGDNKADIAVYRPGASQGYFYYLKSNGGGLVSTPFGAGTVRPNVGDYDGDNKADFCIHYDAGSGSGAFALLKSTGGTEFVSFGLTSDKLAPGDYDGDGKSDFTVVRTQNGQLNWFTLTRAGTFTGVAFGAATDLITPGDYDGDGKQDVGVWRPSTGSGASIFYSLDSTGGALRAFSFGAGTDYPAANWYVH